MSKSLDRISKLLAKAENAGTPEEAEAFMAKVQEMATLNGIDLAVARMHQAKKEKVQEVEERRIQVNPYNRRHNRKFFVDLALAIADVNDCESLISGGEIAIIAMGFPSDLDVVEALFAHLSVQMVAECESELKAGANKEVRRVLKTERVEIPHDDRDWGGFDGKGRYYDDYESEDGWSLGSDRWGNTKERKAYPPPKFENVPVLDEDGKQIYEEKEISIVDGRVFRTNFYDAFVTRIKGRLWQIRRSAEREAGVLEVSSETGLALRDKKKEVADAHNQRISVMHLRGSYSGAEVSNYSSHGLAAGANAADRTPINEGRAVKG